MTVLEHLLRDFLRKECITGIFEHRINRGENLLKAVNIVALVGKMKENNYCGATAITAGFVWADSKEGQAYWNKISEKWIKLLSNHGFRTDKIKIYEPYISYEMETTPSPGWHLVDKPVVLKKGNVSFMDMEVL